MKAISKDDVIVNTLEQYTLIKDDIVNLINAIPHTKDYYTLEFLPWFNECTTYHLEDGDNKIAVSFFIDEKIKRYDIKYVDDYYAVCYTLKSDNTFGEWNEIKNKLIKYFL